MYWLRHVHDRARAALSILKISEIEEILAPFAAKFAQAMMKPYYLESEIFAKRCIRICFAAYDKFERRYLTLKAMRSVRQWLAFYCYIIYNEHTQCRPQKMLHQPL
jgi:hypothetical protein